MNTNMTAQKSVAIALGVLAAVATVGALATTTSPSSVLYVAPQLTRTQSAVHAVAGPAARSSYLRTQAAVANPVEQEGIIYRPVEQAIAKEAFSFNFVMGSVASIAGIIGAVLASRSLPRKQAADMQIALLAASGSKVSNQGSKVQPHYIIVLRIWFAVSLPRYQQVQTYPVVLFLLAGRKSKPKTEPGPRGSKLQSYRVRTNLPHSILFTPVDSCLSLHPVSRKQKDFHFREVPVLWYSKACEASSFGRSIPKYCCYSWFRPQRSSPRSQRHSPQNVRIP